MDIEDLLKRLFSAKYSTISGDYRVISGNHQSEIEKIVREWSKDQNYKTDIKIASLEAKVSLYEAVIRNSNFGPLILSITEEPETEVTNE